MKLDPRTMLPCRTNRTLGLVACAALAACSSGSGGATLELPMLPDGLLRDPAEWILLPRPSRDVECAPGTDCARAFENLIAWATRWDEVGLFPDLTESLDNNNDHDVVTLACALAWRGTDDDAWRERARLLIEQAVATPYSIAGVSALRPGRNLLSYVLAASTIELPALDGALDEAFRAWIERVSEVDRWSGDGVSSGTFRTYQEQRPNNVGLVVGSSRIAVDMYLGGSTHERHVAQAALVVRGFLGDRGAYPYPSGSFGGGAQDNSWQTDVPGHEVGVCPLGAIIPAGGLDVDGCLPEEMRRLGALECLTCGIVPSILCYNRADPLDGGSPPGLTATNYAWEALQGLVMQAYLLQRCAYDAFGWEDAAVERALRFLYVTYGLRAQDTWHDASQPDDPACCDGASDRTQVDDTWVPHIVSALRRPSFLEPSVLVHGGRPGKNCGFADWWTLGLEPPE